MQVIMFSAFAGIFGTGLGGLLSAVLFKRSSENTICGMLSFAAGVMTGIVCFGLVPEAFELAGVSAIVLGLVLGIFVIMGLDQIVENATETKGDGSKEQCQANQVASEHSNDMLRSGMLILIAIGLHNIPEGIAIGAGGSFSPQLGALLALMIALHNIPEGMAVATPLIVGGVSKRKVVLLTALTGSSTILGGIIGMLIGNISDFAIALSLAAAGGAMLYIVFGEIIPQSVVMGSSKMIAAVTLFGIIIGFVVTCI